MARLNRPEAAEGVDVLTVVPTKPLSPPRVVMPKAKGKMVPKAKGEGENQNALFYAS